MSTRVDAERAELRIPARAWVVAWIGIASAAVSLASAAPVTGRISKSYPVTFHPPFLAAATSLCIGTALSIWIGALPRKSVAGWTGGVAGALTGVIVLLGLLGLLPWIDEPSKVVFFATVLLPTLWVMQLPAGLVAASVPTPFRPRPRPVEPVYDDRPHWQREISASLAALSDGRGPLAGGDLQQVTELAFALGNDADAPTAVHQHAANLRSLLSREMDGAALRVAVIAELETALAAAAVTRPYR